MDNIASCIDHTELSPSAPFGRYTELTREAIANKFHSVCVNPFFIKLVSNLLKSHPEIAVCSVISFPFGLEDILSKCEEVDHALVHGATELDLVANISSLKSGDFKRYEDELRSIREESQGHVLKIILEVGLLTDTEIQKASEIAIKLNYNFLKTSTGVNIKLSFEETLKYSKMLVDLAEGSSTLVKASGGIKTLDQCRQLIDVGVKRIGTSSGVKIMEEFNGRS